MSSPMPARACPRSFEFTLHPERVCKGIRCLGVQGECPNLIERNTLHDADHLRDFIAAERGAVAQIKQKPTRSASKLIGWALYKERNLVERFFNRIKRFRRIALRCEKTAAAFNGFVSLACAMAWLN